MGILSDFLDASKERECKMHTKQILGSNNLQVMVSTTGSCDNDEEREKQAYIKIANLANTNWKARIARDQHDNLKEIELLLKGDSEIKTMTDAFEFIIDALERGGKNILY